MEIMKELRSIFDQHWGFNTEDWKDIAVFKNMMATIVRTTNRVLVGLPLCKAFLGTFRFVLIKQLTGLFLGRNEEYLTNIAKYVQDVVVSGAIIRMLPASSKP